MYLCTVRTDWTWSRGQSTGHEPWISSTRSIPVGKYMEIRTDFYQITMNDGITSMMCDNLEVFQFKWIWLSIPLRRDQNHSDICQRDRSGFSGTYETFNARKLEKHSTRSFSLSLLDFCVFWATSPYIKMNPARLPEISAKRSRIQGSLIKTRTTLELRPLFGLGTWIERLGSWKYDFQWSARFWRARAVSFTGEQNSEACWLIKPLSWH